MNIIPEIETRTAEEISRFQLNELKRLLRYVSVSSPFYRELFQKNRIDVGKIQSFEDFASIPPTTKDDMQERNWDFLCVPRGRVAEYMSTSGTLGRPVTIGLTESDLQRLAYNESISFACADGSEEDVYQLMLTLDRQFMAGIAYYAGIQKLGASVIRVGPGVPAMQWDSIMRLRPTTLVAVPSFLLKLMEYAAEHGIDVNSTSVRKAVCIGESLRTSSLDYSAVARRIVENWNIKLYSTYASTEMQTAFTECSHGVGGHLHPELIIAELLSDEGQPVGDNEPGEITVTTLGVEGMPLIRYKTGDIAVAYREPCGCGRTTMRIGPILGRKQHLIKLRGTTIYPNGIFEILNEMNLVQDYVVEAYSGELGTDELRIHVLLNGENPDRIESRLNGVFQSRLRVVPELRFVTQHQLENLQSGKGERKIRKFIDARHRQV
jgi:phenylacetate-CoA ligase